MGATAAANRSSAGIKDRPAAPSVAIRALVLLGACGAVAVSIAIGVLVGLGGPSQRNLFVGVAALVAGVAAATGVMTRFWPTLLLLFSLRPVFDAMKIGALGSGSLDPSTVVGVIFLASALLWLLARHRTGTFVGVSRAAKALLIFAFACGVSALGAEHVFESLATASKVLSAAVMIVVLEQLYTDRPERINALLVAFFASLGFPAIFATIELLGGPKTGDYTEVGRIAGTFVHPNAFATYLTIIVLLAVALVPHLAGRARVATIACGVIASFLLLNTYARGPWLGLLVGLVIIGIAQDRRILGILAVGVVVILIAVPSVTTRLGELGQTEAVGNGDANSLAWRLGYWGRVLPLGEENPVTGIGILMVQKSTPEGLPPHNGFVQAYVETGIFGLAALGVMMVLMGLDLRRALQRAGSGFDRGVVLGALAISASLAVQLLSENLLTQTLNYWYLFVPMAYALAVVARAESRPPRPSKVRLSSAIPRRHL